MIESEVYDENFNWVICPVLLAGEYPRSERHIEKLKSLNIDIFVCLVTDEEIEKMGDYTVHFPKSDVIHLPIEDGYITTDKDVSDLVHELCKHLDNGKRIYIHCRAGHGRTGVIATCLLQERLRVDAEKSIEYFKTGWKTRNFLPDLEFPQTLEQGEQIRRFRKSIKVLMCGDENSYASFSDIVTFEINDLPYGSKILCASAKGVHRLVRKIADDHKIETIEYDIQDPVNTIKNETPDMLIAFHSDVESDHVTKFIIALAFTKSIPVYVHNLKRKSEFLGDFSAL